MPRPKNLFCLLLGHTWVTVADNPKTAWNVDDTGQKLVARPAATPRFFEECARCRTRREVQAPPVVGAAVRRKDG